jgi:hypothetical protein
MTKRDDRKKEWDERAKAGRERMKEREHEFQQYLKEQEGKPTSEPKGISWGWSFAIGIAFIILGRACFSLYRNM